MKAASGYDKRRAAREAQRQRALAGETLAAFHARETAKPPTLAEVFAKNQVNRERCPQTPDMLASAPDFPVDSGLTRPRRGQVMTQKRATYPDRTDVELASIRMAYVDGSEGIADLRKRFGMQYAELYVLIAKHGWPKRGGASKAHLLSKSAANKVKRPHAHKAKSIAQIYKEQKAEQDDRDQELYAGILEDVAMLRRAGFVVTRERELVLVGNRLCTFAEVVELAARERRLRTPVQGFFEGATA